MKRLSYHALLTFPEAEARYQEVRDAFYHVQSQYSTPIGEMRAEDSQTLRDGMNVLIPLAMSDPVNEEMIEKGLHEKSLIYRILSLGREIDTFQSYFLHLHTQPASTPDRGPSRN